MSRSVRPVALVLAVLAALYGVGWFYLSARFGQAVAAWLDAQQAQGITVGRAGIARGGFPLRLEARLTDPSVRFAVGGRTWTWTPGRAVFSAPPWALDRVTLDLSGDHALVAADARGTAAAEVLRVTARLKGAAVVAMDLAARGIEVQGIAVDGRSPIGRFGAESLGLHWRRAAVAPADHLGESHAFEATGAGLRIPEAVRPPLGPAIERFKIAGQVLGELASLRPGMGPGALGPWRDGGGTVEIAQMDARYGALAIAGEGTLALDGEMQPIAALTARIDGFAETIDALRDRGAIAKRDAATAKLILTALARREADGRNRLSVPLTVQDGTLFAGPVALLRVPPIPW